MLDRGENGKYNEQARPVRKERAEVEQSPEEKKKGRLRWWIVGASFVMVFTCLGFCSSTKGLYLAAITEALGLERGLFSINDSIRFLTSAALNLFFGRLIARFGPRKLAAAGFGALIASMLVYSFAENIWLFYLGGALLGTGLAWTTTTMVGYMINVWCREHKGTIMGAVLAANGLGGALAAQILSGIIYGGEDGFGYRTAYRVTAVILFAVGLFVCLIYRDKPAGTQPPVKTEKKIRGESWSGLSFEEAKKKPYFYVAAVCVFLTGMAIQSINGIYSAHFRDVGFDAGFIATVMSIHSVALAAFKFLTGLSYYRIGLAKTMIICNAAAVAMALLLAFANTGPSGKAMAVGYGVISSLALPLETIMLPLIAGDLFGRKAYAKILGIFVSVNTFGYAVGAPLANWCFDQTGSYRTIILVQCGMLAAVAVVFQGVIRAAGRVRRAVEEQSAAV